MAGEGTLQLAIGEVPDLDSAIPGSGDDARLEGVRAKAHTRDPSSMAIGVLDGVLALTESVPELDGAIARSGHDLAVVYGEGDRKHILGVANEAAGGDASGEVPEAELAVPRARESELAVGGEDDVLNEVGMSSEAAARDAIVSHRFFA